MALAKKNFVSFAQTDLYRKRGCVTIRNYAGRCKGICNYNVVYNVLIKLLLLQSSAFVVNFSNTFCHGKEEFPKGSS